MTMDDQDALGLIKERLRGAEGVLRLILEHDTGENVQAVRGAYHLVDQSLDGIRDFIKAHERT